MLIEFLLLFPYLFCIGILQQEGCFCSRLESQSGAAAWYVGSVSELSSLISVPGRSRSETLSCCNVSGAGQKGLSCSQCESHRSSQTLIDSPIPTIHPRDLCLLKRFSIHVRKKKKTHDISRKVSSDNIFRRRQVGFFKIRQLIFASSASLKEVPSLTRIWKELIGYSRKWIVGV